MSQEQIWIIKKDGTPTFVYPFDMQEGDRLATPEEIAVLENGPVPTLEEARTAKLAEIMAGYSAAFAPVKALYPDEEREGWPEQKAEALAYLADPSVNTPVLAELIRQRATGETLEDFARLVLAKSAVWTAVYGRLTGQQQRMCREMVCLAEVEGITAKDVLSYPVAYSLPEGM